jgi:hypothetical protein
MIVQFSDINIGIPSHFHMLRHFEAISDELRKQLLMYGKTEEQIENELSEPGSRFYSTFAVDITSLLHQLSSGQYFQELGLNGNIILQAEASAKLFPNGVGTLSVVPLENIPIQNRDEVFYQDNRGVSLKHFKVGTLPGTHVYTVILKPIDEKQQFITAFPGTAAMPLPDHRMEKDLYAKCKDFWENHVFLVKV